MHTVNPWSNLPNARHIDAVIASVKANPKIWAEAWEKSGRWTEARCSAWDAAREAVRAAVLDAVLKAADDAARPPTYDAAWNVSQDAAWNAAWNSIDNAILALVAHGDCAHLLTTNPDHVKMMTGLGDEAAILLHPASIVFSEIKNDCLV